MFSSPETYKCKSATWEDYLTVASYIYIYIASVTIRKWETVIKSFLRSRHVLQSKAVCIYIQKMVIKVNWMAMTQSQEMVEHAKVVIYDCFATNFIEMWSRRTLTDITRSRLIRLSKSHCRMNFNREMLSRQNCFASYVVRLIRST